MTVFSVQSSVLFTQEPKFIVIINKMCILSQLYHIIRTEIILQLGAFQPFTPENPDISSMCSDSNKGTTLTLPS